MRRSLAVRIVTLAFVVMVSVPAFAAPQRDDSPFGGFERAISRIVRTIADLADVLTGPK